MAIRRPFSAVFSELDVTNSEAVGRFLYWLYHGLWPGEEPWASDPLPPGTREGHESGPVTEEEAVELFWGLDAPRPRAAMLLWQLLQGDRHLIDFTVTLEALTEDATGCALMTLAG